MGIFNQKFYDLKLEVELLRDTVGLNEEKIKGLQTFKDESMSCELVFCDVCGVAIHKEMAKSVIINKELERFYCEKHAPKFDETFQEFFDAKGKIQYYRNQVEVDRYGKEIK